MYERQWPSTVAPPLTHRVADGRDADYFTYRCTFPASLNPVYDYTGADPNPNPHPHPHPRVRRNPLRKRNPYPRPHRPRAVHSARLRGHPFRPCTPAAAMSALEQLRTELPYWNASGSADHIFLFSHDEGACW